jgi:hypothetical protein
MTRGVDATGRVWRFHLCIYNNSQNAILFKGVMGLFVTCHFVELYTFFRAIFQEDVRSCAKNRK